MRIEFIDAFHFLNQKGLTRLSRTLKIKLEAIRYCKHVLDDENSKK